MKFLNGFWLLREGVTLHKAAQAYEIQRIGDSLRITAPTRVITERGQMLNLPVLTIELSSPGNDMIRVRACHHAGAVDHGPHFALTESPAEIEITETEDEAVYRSGKLEARVSKGAFGISYWYDGRFLTESGEYGLAYVQDSDGKAYMREMLNISVGEKVYGLGERFTNFVKNGQTVDLWNEDGGTCTQIAYKNVPLHLSNRGYGVFVNDSGPVSYEIGTEVVSKTQFTVPGETLDYFILGGGCKKALSLYTGLTGKPALPPAWSFGLWLSTSFTTNYDEETVSSFIDGMFQREIPLSVFHYDCFWMKGFRWCDLEFDKDMFHNPGEMLARIKEKGVRICLWINPYVSQLSGLFPEGAEKGYFLKKPNGDVWQWDLWQPGMAVVDFTNPAACDWYGQKLEALLDLGVDCFKTDFGERIPTDVVYFNGADPIRMHNYYTQLYNQTVFNVLKKKFGEGRATLFARSGTAGTQQFPVHWGGDCVATYESMAETLRGGLSLSMSGYAFWSHDISGFETTASPDLYKRWTAFGLMSSHSRLHGSKSYRVPWNFDEEAVDVLRTFTKLKLRLMPYLFAQAEQAHRTGVPMMRPMVLEFCEDPLCGDLDTQYMMGDSLLVAPIFNDKSMARYYLPSGKWTNLFTGEVLEGSRYYEAPCGYEEMPLFVRENTILALGAHDDCAEYEYANSVTYRMFDVTNAHARVLHVDGTVAQECSAVLKDDGLYVTVSAAPFPWKVEYNGKTAEAPAGTTELII